jgi:hypothetical protein
MNKGAVLQQILKSWIANNGLFHHVAFTDEQHFAKFFGLDPMSADRVLRELELAGYCRRRPSDRKLIVSVPDWLRTPEPLVDAIPVAVNEAFMQEEVSIDIEAYTGETFLAAMKEKLENLRSGESKLRSLHIRMLIPNFKKEVAVPSVVGAPDDPSARERQEEISQRVITLLKDIKGLQILDYGRNAFLVRVEIGRIDYFTPWEKVFIFNGKKVLRGEYEVVQVPVSYKDRILRINDFRGFDVEMSTSTEEKVVQGAIRQFASKWELAEVVVL